MQNNANAEEIRIKDQKKKLKKIILIVFAAALFAVLLCVLLLNLPKSRSESTDYTDALQNYEFYPVVWENIFDDPDYTEDMRRIFFEDVSEGIRGYVLDDENISSFEPSVKFMYNYINYIINGDVKGYNSSFSDAYYEKIYPKSSFTMQRLYDIKLYKVEEYSHEGYLVYVFKLQYRILKNDGTFRKDISSTTSRTKTIYLTAREGKLAIDGEIIQHIQHKDVH